MRAHFCAPITNIKGTVCHNWVKFLYLKFCTCAGYWVFCSGTLPPYMGRSACRPSGLMNLLLTPFSRPLSSAPCPHHHHHPHQFSPNVKDPPYWRWYLYGDYDDGRWLSAWGDVWATGGATLASVPTFPSHPHTHKHTMSNTEKHALMSRSH